MRRTLVIAAALTAVTTGIRAQDTTNPTERFETSQVPDDEDRSDRVEVEPPGMAQQDPLEPRDASPPAPKPDPSAEMLAKVQTVIHSIRSKTAMPSEPFAHLKSKEEVRIVNLSDLAGLKNDQAQDLEEVVRANTGVLGQIREQAQANIFVVRAFEDAGQRTDDILTWETAGTTVVTFVVDDRATNDAKTSKGG